LRDIDQENYQKVKIFFIILKAFTILPSLKNWEELLNQTKPENWSFQTVERGTEIFASSTNPKIAQRFFNLVSSNIKIDFVTKMQTRYL
jgi:hypothetical protein